jgi:flap endonuclease-1
VLLRDCRPQKRLITEIRLSVLLEELQLTQPQFVDLCILCGCDFSSSLRSLSYAEALPAIRERGTIEEILVTMPCPESFTYKAAREIFLNPPNIESATQQCCFRSDQPDPKALDDFLRRKVGYRRR